MSRTAWTPSPAVSTMRTVRVLPHVTKLDDRLGDIIVRVTCPCAASPHIEAEALARIAGALGDVRGLGEPYALLTAREEGRRGRGGGEPEAALSAEGSPQVSPARLGSIQ